MKVYTEILPVTGCEIEGEHPLPVFCDIQRDKPSKGDGTLTAEEEDRLGKNTGYRVLPYRMQDKYNRNKRKMYLKTVVLENQYLKAAFLPEYGGRLYSLKNKETGKEILYKNPVFQPANLGIRNAWFSGGVEWNVAQYGHTMYSSSPVFFAEMTGEHGEKFLRMYDFERMKRLFVQLDFHLPEDSKVLYVHVEIINQDKMPKSMYWWSNIAIQSEEKLRVFSGTEDVLYLHPESISDNTNPVRIFGRGKLPYIPTLPGLDSTYPSNADYSNEFFFQNPASPEKCWSAAAYGDGRVFFERSTLPLRYRKMFCWGSHQGGKRWCSYLATAEDGDYVELQAGLAPTQLNGLEIPADTTWKFTQAIGETKFLDADAAYGNDYHSARENVETIVEGALLVAIIEKNNIYFEIMAQKPTEEILSMGTGWGTLERLRTELQGEDFPSHLLFPDSALGKEQYPWYCLLTQGFLPELSPEQAPESWMVDEKFYPLLKESLEKSQGCHYLTWLHLGVMEYERGNRKAGAEAWENSLKLCPSPFTLRNLAWDRRLDGDMDKAVELMKGAVEKEDNGIDKIFSEEYMDLLLENGKFGQAWAYYQKLPEERKKGERLTLQAALAGVELKEYSFVEKVLSREFACIREGDNSLTDLFTRYHVLKKLDEPENTMTLKEAQEYVEKNCIPPKEIDFRMFVKRGGEEKCI
ncbi:MAG: DUF5107 domain-containing protein [Eubacteriales bacterium]|nr:DUF5107 domain-containing protein [Eubacteriales bacterium]